MSAGPSRNRAARPWAARSSPSPTGCEEYQHGKALQQLEKDLEEGRITREEFLERRQVIRERSVVY